MQNHLILIVHGADECAEAACLAQALTRALDGTADVRRLSEADAPPSGATPIEQARDRLQNASVTIHLVTGGVESLTPWRSMMLGATWWRDRLALAEGRAAPFHLLLHPLARHPAPSGGVFEGLVGFAFDRTATLECALRLVALSAGVGLRTDTDIAHLVSDTVARLADCGIAVALGHLFDLIGLGIEDRIALLGECERRPGETHVDLLVPCPVPQDYQQMRELMTASLADVVTLSSGRDAPDEIELRVPVSLLLRHRDALASRISAN